MEVLVRYEPKSLDRVRLGSSPTMSDYSNYCMSNPTTLRVVTIDVECGSCSIPYPR
jgi:hypothetical protein